MEWNGTPYNIALSSVAKAALVVYYHDPEIVWIKGGTPTIGGSLPSDGYYNIFTRL
jgi:hypothetical protein